MNIQEFRRQYPEYQDMSDQALADSLYQKSYSDMDRKEFDAKFLGAAPAIPPAAPAPTFWDQAKQKLGEFGKGVVNQLPTVGMMAGGTIGTAAGGGVMSPVLGVAGAGLGAGIGAGARDWINEGLGITPPKSPAENWQNMGKEAAFGAGAEMAGPLISKGIQKVISPFAGKVTERMAADPSIKAAQDLVEKGAPISPEVIAGTKTSRFFDWLAEKIWPANAVMAGRRQSLQPLADGLKSEFVTSRGLYDTSKGGVNQAWENWVNLAGGTEAPYELPKTLQALNDASKKPFAMQMKTTTDAAGNQVTESVPLGVFWKKYASTLKDTLETKGHATVQDIRDILNVLNPTGAKGAERTARMKIGDALMSDLGASGNQEMVDALSNARDLARLQRIAGPLQSIFNRATIPAAKAGEETAFSPANFVNLWNQQRGKFLDNKNYSAEDIRVIDAFADKMKALVPDLAMGSKFTPPTSLGGISQFNLENPLAVGAGVYKFPALSVPVGMDTMLAYSLMNKNGIMRKFLTTGFKPPTLSTKIGIQKGMEATQ